MKRLVGLFLAGSLAFASGSIYLTQDTKPKKVIKKVDIPFLFKETALNNIQDVSISHDNKKVILATNNKLKIFDTKEEELIKTLKFSNSILKTQFSKDNKKIYILTNKVFYIYDNNTYKKIAQINMLNNNNGDEYLENFFIRGNLLGIIEQYDYGNYGYYNSYSSNDHDYSTIRIFNLKNGKEIKNFKVNDLVYNGDFSPNLKKIALTSNSKNYAAVPYIYNLDGEILHKLPQFGKYYHIKWLNKRDVVVESTNRAYIFDIKTSKTVATIKTKNNIAKIKVLDNNNIAIFIYNHKLRIFNVAKKDFLNDKEYNFKGEYRNDALRDVALSDDRKYLAVGYKSKNMKFFDTSKVLKYFTKATESSNNSNENTTQITETKQETKKTTETKPQVIIKKVIEPKIIIKKEVVEKVIVKTVKVKDTENKKPTLSIYASQTAGEVPLKVNFKFIANDEDGKIASYYLNFAGKEVMQKGNPTKSFNYTFKNAGKYKIMVAVKDDKGAIATKEIVINVKPKHEESFEDYKRNLMGR